MYEDEKIGILNILGYISYGGIESLIYEFSKNIDRDRFIYDVISSNTGDFSVHDRLRNTGAKIYYVPAKRKRPILHIITLFQVLYKNRDKYSIIHAHLTYKSWIPLCIAKLVGYKVRIAHSHTSYINTQISLMIKLECLLTKKSATNGVGCSKYAFEFLFGKKTRPNIINNCINYSSFYFNSIERKFYRNELKINEYQRAFISVGRVENEKNFSFLILCWERKKNSDDLLYIIGDGKERKELEKIVKLRNLDDKIKFLGNRDDVCKILNAFDGFLLPSKHEGFPVVLIEAQVNGLPCIASDNISKETQIGGCIDYIPINVDNWVFAMDRLPKRNKDRFMGDYKYNSTEVTNCLENYYMGLLNR